MKSLNRAAWWCPSCSTYHAPHCDSCTKKADAVSRKRQPIVVPVIGRAEPVVFAGAGGDKIDSLVAA